jgi:hypothetical protein
VEKTRPRPSATSLCYLGHVIEGEKTQARPSATSFYSSKHGVEGEKYHRTHQFVLFGTLNRGSYTDHKPWTNVPPKLAVHGPLLGSQIISRDPPPSRNSLRPGYRSTDTHSLEGLGGELEAAHIVIIE